MYFCNILAMRIACLMKGMAHTVCVQEFDWFINTFHIFFGNCNFLCWYWIEFSLVAIFFRHKVNWLDFRCVENYFGDFLFCNCPKICKFIWVVDCTFLLMKCWLKCLDLSSNLMIFYLQTVKSIKAEPQVNNSMYVIFTLNIWLCPKLFTMIICNG